MHTLLRHLAPLCWFCTQSFVTGSPMLNTPSVPISIVQPQHLVNSTLSSTIPPEFSINVLKPEGPKLPSLLCFEAAVLAIANHLALEDFTGRIPAQGWSLSNLIIAVSTKYATGDTIERRFVVWGICNAVGRMKAEKRFNSVVIELRWHGNVVGSISFYPKDLPILDAQSNSTTITQLDSPVSSSNIGTNGFASSVPITLGDPVPSFKFYEVQPPEPLDQKGMYINVLGILVNSAQYPADTIFRSSYSISVKDSAVETIVSGANNAQPPTRPPFLRHRWIIRAMAVLPATLVKERLKNSFKVEINLDNVAVGDVLFEPLKSEAAPALLGSSQQDGISVSTG